ncbi:MAG TPA: protein-L-isoaspartate(D-aspartate) O-methyltransferase [Dongiaceae bacterium]|jgi:protein-L-isoaspartate(D-aspartate) O-methyltransferase|nr:protein-L-isoaspartate(D-aspartate) O-methyltransferase [Dongiaceae bacterium]
MPSSEEFDFAALRAEMVDTIAVEARLVSPLIGRDRFDDRVMTTMATVPRHDFVPAELRELAYFNVPLPIGFGKTISQPFIVALMTELLELDEGDAVLEIGTGLGYQAAILSKLAGRVYTMEIIDELAQEARKRLHGLGYEHIEFKVGDGSRGWPEHAPYDKIIVAAAPETIPAMLVGQLKPGGRMVIPVGQHDEQHLCLLTKGHDDQIETKMVLQVRFTPLIRSH